jgi:hypothetical protein
MISEMFSPKKLRKNWRFWTKNTDILCQKSDNNIAFQGKKRQFFTPEIGRNRRKQ